MESTTETKTTMTEEQKAEIKSLRQEQYNLEERIRAIRKQIKEISQVAFFSRIGCQFGDLIEYRDGASTLKGVLSSYDGHYAWVRPLKKDGNVGVRICRVWNTESVKPIKTEHAPNETI